MVSCGPGNVLQIFMPTFSTNASKNVSVAMRESQQDFSVHPVLLFV